MLIQNIDLDKKFTYICPSSHHKYNIRDKYTASVKRS